MPEEKEAKKKIWTSPAPQPASHKHTRHSLTPRTHTRLLAAASEMQCTFPMHRHGTARCMPASLTQSSTGTGNEEGAQPKKKKKERALEISFLSLVPLSFSLSFSVSVSSPSSDQQQPQALKGILHKHPPFLSFAPLAPACTSKSLSLSISCSASDCISGRGSGRRERASSVMLFSPSLNLFSPSPSLPSLFPHSHSIARTLLTRVHSLTLALSPPSLADSFRKQACPML